MHPIIRKRILNRFNNTCVKCGSREKLEIDHIIPISRNGREDEDNMQILCKTCNLKKGRGLNFDKYFKKGDGKDYLFIRQDFPVWSFNGDEFKAVIEQKFKEYCNG